jgi:anti-anti-sigma factor
MADGLLDIVVRAEADRVTLVLSGDIDMGSGGALRTCIQELDHGWRCVVLDMGSVTFLDSSGIAVILQAQGTLASQYRQLQLRDLPHRVRMVLELTGVLDTLTVLPAATPEVVT